jgi:hypothetical protein
MRLTPDTRVGALLDAHPDLLEALIERVPAFGKLRNPLLRKTIAQVATLEMAARGGGVPLPELLAFLRERLGQPPEDAQAESPAPRPVPSEPPAWFRPEAVVLRLDADQLLAAGEHPVARIRTTLANHPPGATVEVTSSFEPAPLVELFSGEGPLVACYRLGDGFRTCLRRP